MLRHEKNVDGEVRLPRIQHHVHLRRRERRRGDEETEGTAGRGERTLPRLARIVRMGAAVPVIGKWVERDDRVVRNLDLRSHEAPGRVARVVVLEPLEGGEREVGRGVDGRRARSIPAAAGQRSPGAVERVES